MVHVDTKCCGSLSLDSGIKIYAFLQVFGLICLIAQLVLFPNLFNAWMPLLLIYLALTIGILSLLFIPGVDNHAKRLLFFNFYVLFGLILFYSWFVFVLYNDWWDNGAFIMCRDTYSNPQPQGSAGFDECYKETQKIYTIEYSINFFICLYVSYILKAWADEKKEDDFEE